jgi:tetratricopeptide (TPR) repeat protein
MNELVRRQEPMAVVCLIMGSLPYLVWMWLNVEQVISPDFDGRVNFGMYHGWTVLFLLIGNLFWLIPTLFIAAVARFNIANSNGTLYGKGKIILGVLALFAPLLSLFTMEWADTFAKPKYHLTGIGNTATGVVVGNLVIVFVFSAAYLFWANRETTKPLKLLVLSSFRPDSQSIFEDKNIKELDLEYATAYLKRGIAHAQMGQFKHAIDEYNRAIELDGGNAYAYLQRGNSLYGLSQYQQAILDYDQVIKINPDLGRAYFERGMAYQALG